MRPHQVGNPDAIQYTPAFTASRPGSSIRAKASRRRSRSRSMSGSRSGWSAREARGDVRRRSRGPALRDEAAPTAAPGRVPPTIDGDGVELGGLRHDPPSRSSAAERPVEPMPGAIGRWEVSNAFARARPARGVGAGRGRADGLLDLARAQGSSTNRTPSLPARRSIPTRPRRRRLESASATAHVCPSTGRRSIAGDDAYRSRDYRFLGSIGWYDAAGPPRSAPVRRARRRGVVRTSAVGASRRGSCRRGRVARDGLRRHRPARPLRRSCLGRCKQLLELSATWPLAFAPDGASASARFRTGRSPPAVPDLRRRRGGRAADRPARAGRRDIPAGRADLALLGRRRKRAHPAVPPARRRTARSSRSSSIRVSTTGRRSPLRDGSLLAYTTNRGNSVDFEVVVRNLASGEDRTFDLRGYVAAHTSRRDGRWIVA